MGRSFGRFVLSASSETQGKLQSSSKILKHFPNVDLGNTVVSVLQNTRGSTLGRERAHYSENKSVRSKNIKNFPENTRETVSVSMICDEYCSRDHFIVSLTHRMLRTLRTKRPKLLPNFVPRFSPLVGKNAGNEVDSYPGQSDITTSPCPLDIPSCALTI